MHVRRFRAPRATQKLSVRGCVRESDAKQHMRVRRKLQALCQRCVREMGVLAAALHGSRVMYRLLSLHHVPFGQLGRVICQQLKCPPAPFSMKIALGGSRWSGPLGGTPPVRPSSDRPKRRATSGFRAAPMTVKQPIYKRPSAGVLSSGAGVRANDSPKSGITQKTTSDYIPASHWGVPPGVAAKLDTWGMDFAGKVRECGRVSLQARGLPVTWPSRDQLRVGTDCSGAEAPVWALKGMGLSHVHAFSCDIEASVRRFIQATSPPQGPIYADMLKRPPSELPDFSVYICGFPCKPYSSLRRHSTKLLKEASAKPFFAVVRLLRERRPVLAVLENVRGIQAVFKQVFAQLRRIAGYFVFVVPMDSADLGEPVSRPRFYFVLVRQDVAISKDVSFLSTLVEQLSGAGKAKVVDHASERMLPPSSPAVQEFLASQRKRQKGSKKTHASGRAGVRAGARACGRGGVTGDEQKFGLTPRQASALAEARAKQVAGATDILVDVSQSEDRVHGRFNGICPTLTPGALVVVERSQRVLMPIEKLLLHGFPVHRMNIPTSTTNTDLASLGGNTMHVRCVGLALLIGVCLVNWGHRSARPGQEPAGAVLPATTVVSQLRGPEGTQLRIDAKRKPAQSKKVARRVKRKV